LPIPHPPSGPPTPRTPRQTRSHVYANTSQSSTHAYVNVNASQDADVGKKQRAEIENKDRYNAVASQEFTPNASHHNPNSRSQIEFDQRQHSRHSRTGSMNSNTKRNTSMNSNSNTKRNTTSRRSSETLKQSGREHGNILTPAAQHRRSVTHKGLARSAAAAADDDDDDDNDEVLSTSYASLKTAQVSERQRKNVSATSHGNSRNPPSNEKRIMFGKLPSYLVMKKITLF